MTIYNVIIISHGEVPLSLDGVYTFTNEKDARKKLRERYHIVLDDVEGYEITDEEFGDKYYRVEIDDDVGSIYEGYIRKTEIEEKDEGYENQKQSLSELSNIGLVKAYDFNPSGMILDELASRNLHTVCDLCRKGKIAEAVDWLNKH